ncbi:MAG: hypothetical protein HKL82_08185, partial [Acidimicrobiaceae bacterium]|nr:hypothetical protein [Acidimicrobiaceae bacterium]
MVNEVIRSEIDNRLLKYRGRGYMLAAADGKVFTFGDMAHHGDASSVSYPAPIT